MKIHHISNFMQGQNDYLLTQCHSYMKVFKIICFAIIVLAIGFIANSIRHQTVENKFEGDVRTGVNTFLHEYNDLLDSQIDQVFHKDFYAFDENKFKTIVTFTKNETLIYVREKSHGIND